MEVWKIIFLSKWVICRFHVNLPGCIPKWTHNLGVNNRSLISLWFGAQNSGEKHQRHFPPFFNPHLSPGKNTRVSPDTGLRQQSIMANFCVRIGLPLCWPNFCLRVYRGNTKHRKWSTEERWAVNEGVVCIAFLFKCSSSVDLFILGCIWFKILVSKFWRLLRQNMPDE